MLLLPVEHSAPGSLEECHGVIAMTMDCQLESLLLNAGVRLRVADGLVSHFVELVQAIELPAEVRAAAE